MKKLLLIFIFLIFFPHAAITKNSNKHTIAAIIYAEPFLISLKGFKDGLKKIGYKNNTIFYTYNLNRNLKKIPEILNEIYKNNTDLIFATTTPVNLSLKKYLKKDIPVIFNEVADPVGCGLVKSLKSSGNNFTGVTHAAMELIGKRLEIFKDMFPQIKNVYVFYDPLEKFLNTQLIIIEKYAKFLNLKIVPFYVTNRKEIEYIVNHSKIDSANSGIFMGPSASVMANVDLIIKFSRINKVPLMVIDNVVLSKGGCVGYSPDFYSVGYQSAYIADKIFKGAKPENIPIEYPEKISLVINLKEIEKLGIKFNKNYLIYADKVIK